ncbi:MAG: hypothetical protein GWO11_05195 [Desulfuromonadales bacterium]|nr:hypothetical protein [Desulfuromonadales bacterium]NIR33792.1 hypothetical protein [Desulfuromonadales bacterium]NIS42490.1 hypothetical protein [Desulfuromonadales bacterium]
MPEIIEITPVTLKRLLNYQRVVDNSLKKAAKDQWIDMTLEKMETCHAARQKAGHVNTASAYADFLFRVQNGLMPYRTLSGEFLLRNALVELLGELDIPVTFIRVPNANTQHAGSTNPPERI